MSLDNQDAGFILFSKSVPRGQIAEFMDELKATHDNFEWVDLHMRDSGGETILAYRVDFKTSRKDKHTRFHQETLGRLKKIFGEEPGKRPTGVKLWSMANVLESAT